MPVLALAAAAVTAAPGDARAQGLGIDATGLHADFGTVNAGDTALLPAAVNLVINASSSYSLLASAPAGLTSLEGGALPIGRIAWRHAGLGNAFASFVEGLNTILDAAPATAAVGRTVSLDLRFSSSETDWASAPGDPYRAAIVFTVTAGTIDSSYAWPNPFSPDGDGVNDRTDIHWYAGEARTVDVLVYAADGNTLVRTLTVARAFGTGDNFIAWDGRNDDREVVPEGTYLYRVRITDGAPVDPGLTIASGVIYVEVGSLVGTGAVQGAVTSSQGGGPLVGATVELHRAGGAVAASQATDTAGGFAFASVGAGLYTLQVSAPSHYTYTSQTFEVLDGTTVTMNVRLVHNHSLVVRKRAIETAAAPGDVVGYLLEVTASGVDVVEDVQVLDQLPAAVRLVTGSARRDAGPLPSGGLVVNGGSLRFVVGRLEPGRTVSLYYEAVVVAGTKPGALINTARATGVAAGVAVESDPSHATVYVNSADTGDRSLLFGRVFVDEDGDGAFGPGDEPAGKAYVIIDDGSIVIVDAEGRYSARGVKPGARGVMAVLNVLEGAPRALIPQGPSKLVLVQLQYGVAVHQDFAFTPEEAGGASSAYAGTKLGVGDVTLGLDWDRTPVLHLAGRLAGFLELDLGNDYRLTVYADTAKRPREELTTSIDERFFQPEVGDRSTLVAGVPDKVGVRLNAPWGQASLGRFDANPRGELMNDSRLVLGAEVIAARGPYSGRVFAGLADTERRLDRFLNEGGIGPYRLTAAPIVPMTEIVEVEARDADGSLAYRERLAAGRYTLDYVTGLLYFAEPWPQLGPDGEELVFYVQYDYAPQSDVPPMFIAGGQVGARIGERVTVTASARVDEAKPETREVAGVEAAYVDRRASVHAEAAVSNGGPTLSSERRGTDATALRLRASYLPMEQVETFAYLSRIGGGFAFRPQSRLPVPQEPPFGHFPPPLQTVLRPRPVRSLFYGPDQMPFYPEDVLDLFEWGIGSRWQAMKELQLALGSYDMNTGLDGELIGGAHREHSEFVAARWQRDQLPVAFASLAQTTYSDASELALQLASGWTTRDWQLGAETRIADREARGVEQTGMGALLRAQFTRYPRIVPGVLMLGTQTSNDGDGVATEETRMAAVGAESQLGGAMVYAYAHAGTRGTGGVRYPQKGAFAGADLRLGWLEGNGRIDLTDREPGGLVLTLSSRSRILWRSLGLFAYLTYTSENGELDATWDHILGFSYRPRHGPAYLFLKLRDRSVPLPFEEQTGVSSRRSQLMAFDVVLPVSPTLQAGTRFAAKRTESVNGWVGLSMVGEQVSWRFWKAYEVIVGARMAREALAGHTLWGATAALGWYAQKTLRVAVGVNLSESDRAFEVDDSIPGLFLNVTGVYGAAGETASVPW